MGTYKNKAYTLRIDNVLMDKIKTIATTEDRPISKQIERMLKDQVEQYEHENDGTIHNVNM